MKTRFCLALTVFSSLSHAATGCEALPGPITPGVLWPQVWQALTDQSSCTQNCHIGANPSADLDLSSPVISIYFLVSQDSSQDNAVKRVVPCTYEDYLNASQGDLPQRWIRLQALLS